MDKNKFDKITYVDSQGYRRWNDQKTLVHRSLAYKGIYLKNKKKYNFPFSEYQVHHIDKNITNNRMEIGHRLVDRHPSGNPF